MVKLLNQLIKGDFLGFINNNKILLKDVYFVPKVTKNIISINKLTKDHYKIIFSNNNNNSFVIIYDHHGNRIISTKSDSQGIYPVWLSNAPLNFKRKYENKIHFQNLLNITKIDKINLWHRRLGHFNINNIKHHLLKINIKTKCPICSNSKMKNLPFRKSANKTTSIFELVHLDIVGPVQESLHGNKYFLTILDDYSRFGWVYFLEGKNDTFNKFHIWTNEIYNIYNKPIKHIRSDNGKEFNNCNINSFCLSKGIIHQFTVPHNPQQNGRAERLNGILISSAKALLNDTKLCHQFWEYAVDTANYIHNRLPHSGINNKIPFKILFNKDVDYSHFKVFGCRVFFYVPKSLRNKFENNALPGIFLGYHPYSSSYKILNINTNQIILSRAVEFFEQNPGNANLRSRVPYEFSNFIPHLRNQGEWLFSIN